jgi:hypothetical protein
MMVSLVYPLTAIVPNYSAFRKRNRKRESQHHVSGCETSRSLSHCWLRLAHCAGEGVGDAGAWVSSAM